MLAEDLSKRRAKTLMCPLKDQCSDDIRPRWPASGIRTIKTFGHKCEFAHHTYELKFRQELNAKKKILKNMLEKLGNQLEGDIEKKPFIVGGAKFTECLGCGQKNLCSICQLRKGVAQKLKTFQDKAARSYMKITNKPSFQKKYKEKKEFTNEFIKKIGYLRKSLVLYESRKDIKL